MTHATQWLAHLDPRSPVPLYEQIIEGVALAIAAGELKPGDTLPSVRNLAVELRLNPNTTARALRALDRHDLARPVRGVGTVVAEDAADAAKELARRALGRELGAAVTVARQMGMELEDLSAALEKAWRENHDADRS